MKAAYVDTSALVALLLDDAGSARMRKRISGFDRLLAASFMEAELRSALHREEVGDDPEELWEMISWVHPDRRLTDEIIEALSIGHLRGADLWHIATALYIDPETSDLTFLTLDQRQRSVAEQLGFLV
ncbi:MAG TPA: type II toxin-antitoxin system VapC family toxin [Thermoanaerobaculia bacterium]|nr:type II toxin-antitoxin system VapC family toxin [Thermoanaerobaculia bacterium]